jgi:hypothetical protein
MDLEEGSVGRPIPDAKRFLRWRKEELEATCQNLTWRLRETRIKGDHTVDDSTTCLLP